jgi:Tfp pilus assembly protein PilF
LKLGPASELLLQDGMLRVQERDFKNAQKSLEKVLERNPEDLRALKVLVGSYVLQNQKDAALPTVQAHVQRRPKSALLQNYLGQMLLADGKPAQAMAAFLAAKAADPNSQAADLSLAQVDVVQGNIDRAQQKLLALAAANGGDVSALLALASVEQTAKRTEQAGDHYRAVLEKDANNLIALNNYAFLLSETPGRTDEALKYAQHAKELAPNDPMISDTLGWIYVQKKMYKPAIEQLETALSKRQMAPIYYHLGVAYLQAGDRARSRELLTSALKLDPTLSDATAALRLAGSGLR